MKSTSKKPGRVKPAATAPRPKRPAAAPRPAPTPREIAALAYEIYARSGHQAGREVEFWLEAERQLERGPRK